MTRKAMKVASSHANRARIERGAVTYETQMTQQWNTRTSEAKEARALAVGSVLRLWS
jgi:hypothetical protein